MSAGRWGGRAAVLMVLAWPGLGQAQDGGQAVPLLPGFGSWSAMGSVEATEPLASRADPEWAAPCQGFLISHPAAVLEVDDAVAGLRLHATTSRPDMLMLVLGPDGFIQCAQQVGHTPGMGLSNPRPGRYEVFLGLAEQGEWAGYTLLVEERSAEQARATSADATEPAPEVGGIPDSVVEDVVYAHVDELQTCREVVHAENPDYSGRVVTQWTVGLDGAVTDANVLQAAPPNAALEACVLEVVRGFRFTPPAQLTVITFPFDFFPL